MMKRVLSLFVALSLMLCVFNVGYVFAEGEDSALTEVIDEQITEEQPEPTAEEALPTPTPEFTEEPVGEDENENIEDENVGDANADDASYEVVQVPTGEYAAINIAARDLEVYVTDGTNPISGAAVTVGGQMLTTGEDGIVTFEDLPTSYEKYVISVTSEVYGEKSSDVVLEDSIMLGDEGQSVDTKVKYVISYWSPESEIMSLSNSATEQGSPWTYDVNSGLSTGGDLYEYNGLIYLAGEYNRVYIPATGSWRILTGQGYIADALADCTAFYNGKLYEHASWWGAGGDSYIAGYKITEYDIYNNTSRILVSRSVGGHFYEAAVACNGRIYFSGGTYVVYDEDVAQDYEQVDYYDIDEETEGTVIVYGGSDYPVLCTQPGEYYNHIFYFGWSDSDDILCVDTSDNSYEFLSGDGGYTNLYEEMACAVDNKVYFMGGATNSELEECDVVSTVRIYDIQSGTWSTGANMPYATAGATLHVRDGKIYLVGGYYARTKVQIYDISTNSWSCDGESNLYLGSGKSAMYNGRIYALTFDGTLCIYRMDIYEVTEQTDAYTVYKDRNGAYWREGIMTDDIDENVDWVKTPLKIEYPFAIRQLDAYRNQTLAINELGQVLAWGEGYFADGTDSSTTITYPTVISGIDNPVAVSRGKNHNLVLDINGDVWGWGSNSNYPMGRGAGKIRTASKLSGISNVQQIAAGTEFSLFLKKDGTVWSVGVNTYGQLGLGDTERRLDPERIPSLSEVEKISVGEDYALALTSDGLYSWGRNNRWQLGDGTNEMCTAPKKISVELEDGEEIIDISAGIDFALLLTDMGHVYSWGAPSGGALGRTGTYKIPGKISTLSGVVKIDAGKMNAFALTENGTLYSWGYGSNGQLGYDMGSSGIQNTPKQVPAFSGKTIADMSCGYAYSAVADQAGNLYTFGYNYQGQLGIYAAEKKLISSPAISDVKWLDSYMSSISQPITSSITLPSTAPNGSSITWKSGNTYYIADGGTLVSRPDCYGSDTDVKLYATVAGSTGTYTPNYTITVKQDPAIKPSTDIPIRSIGFEYDQIYPETAPDVYPEITSVAMSVIDEENGVYQFTIRDDQYVCSQNADPFFFWSARQGTFLPVEGYDDYRSVQFTVDEDALDKNVKVIVGIGDALGYIDRKAIIIDNGSVSVAEAPVSESNIMLLAENNELTESDIESYETSDTGAAVSLAIGIDTSVDMAEFDLGTTKTWMNTIDGLIDSAGETSDMVLVTDDNFGYTKDAASAKSSLELIKTKEYGGSMDALTFLERCEAALSDGDNISQLADRVVVLFVKSLGDADALNAKIEELENNGTAVYIMALSSEETDNVQNENIYVCQSELELRLKIAELYSVFGTVSEVMTMSADAASSSSAYTSDFRADKHMLKSDGNNTFGAAIASVLGIYNCLPAYTEGYNLCNNESVNDAYNVTLGNLSSVPDSNAKIVADYYQEKSEQFKNNKITTNGKKLYDSSVQEIIDNNLRYRFPVVVFNDNGSKIITGKTAAGKYTADGTNTALADGTYSVINTYAYITEIANGINIIDSVKDGEKLYDNIRFTKPKDYTVSENYVKAYKRSDGGAWSAQTVGEENGEYKISSPEANSEIVRSVKVIYDGIVPNVYNSNAVYKVKKYNDLGAKTASLWYYPYLFKATNIGAVNGDENGNVNADASITRAEIFKIIIECGDIKIDDVESTAEFWARKYISYMQSQIDIYKDKEIDDAYFYSEIPREEAAYIIKSIYMDASSEMGVASKLYYYDEAATSCLQLANWKLGKGLGDKSSINGIYLEAVKQLYCNHIMTGDGSLYNPKAYITRAEMCASIVRCLFDLDEGIKNVQIVNEGESNYIDLYINGTKTITQASDKNGSGEFYFVAPKTGYYYVKNLNNCTVTVSDMKKRDIQGLDASSGGARYNLLKGETAYIKVETESSSSSYSFTISSPGDNELVFAPDRSGTFIYDNCPEYIIKADLADSQYGNTALITAENVSGKVTVASSHLARSRDATVDHTQCGCSDDNNLSFDYLITNNSDNPITVTITNIGIQTPAYRGYNENGTYQEAVSYQAWADYTNTNLVNSNNFVGNKYIVINNKPYEYLGYNAGEGEWGNKTNQLLNKTITINSGDSEWLFGEQCINLDLSQSGFPVFIIFDCIISGTATIKSTAFHAKSNINIGTLSSGKIFTKDSLRDYTNEIGGGEINEIGEKYKGVSNSSASVHSEGTWTISDTDDSKFYSPKIYNRSQSNGVQPPVISNNDEYIFRVNDGSNGFNTLTVPTFRYWMTHVNSESARNYSSFIANSDMLGLKFTGTKVGAPEEGDEHKTFYFDNYHTDTANGNLEVGSSDSDPAAIKMANFSVTENYSLTVKNTLSQPKKIYYMVGNGSGMYYEYSITGTDSAGNVVNINNRNLRCVLPWSETDENGKARCVFYEMFSFDIGAGEERKLDFSIVIPNIGVMGVYNILYAE